MFFNGFCFELRTRLIREKAADAAETAAEAAETAAAAAAAMTAKHD